MFKVIRQTTEYATTYTTKTHHTLDRQARYAKVCELGGSPIYSFIVDTNHPNGLELHTILDTGVIVVANYQRQRVITWLIAREGQIKRYGIDDTELLQVARRNAEQGLNYE